MIEPLGERSEGRAGTQGYESFDKPLVSRQRDRCDRQLCRLAQLLHNLLRADSQPGVPRLVNEPDNEHRHVDLTDVTEKNETGSARVQIRRVVIIVELTDAGLHREAEYPLDRPHLVLSHADPACGCREGMRRLGGSTLEGWLHAMKAVGARSEPPWRR